MVRDRSGRLAWGLSKARAGKGFTIEALRLAHMRLPLLISDEETAPAVHPAAVNQ